MRPQLVCGNVSVTCLTIPHSLAGSISSSSHVSTQRWAMARPCRLHPLKGRQVTRLNATVEFKGDLNTEGVAEGLVSSVGTPVTVVSLRDWYLADKQFVVISVSAFVTAGFMAILLAAAIPSLLAMKKAAEALEKLADTAREELPGTMAAIRLSGMEISDLTMELNDLGQEISKGVRSSARALDAA